MRTQLTAMVLVIAVVLVGVAAFAQATRPMAQVLPSNATVLQGERLLIDGRQVSTSAPAIKVGKTVMVPAQPVLKELNATPQWNVREHSLMASARGQQIMVSAGDKNARIGTKTQKLDETPFVYRNELYVPLDFIGSAADVKTNYDAKRKEIMITARGRPGQGVQALPKGGHLLAGTNIVVNGHRLASTTPALMEGKAVMVPGLPVLQAFGARPTWDPRSQRLTAEVRGRRYVFTAGDSSVGAAGHAVKLVEQPFVYEGQLYIPMDDVGRLFGAHVAYQSQQKQIVISGPAAVGSTTSERTPPPHG